MNNVEYKILGMVWDSAAIIMALAITRAAQLLRYFTSFLKTIVSLYGLKAITYYFIFQV